MFRNYKYNIIRGEEIFISLIHWNWSNNIHLNIMEYFEDTLLSASMFADPKIDKYKAFNVLQVNSV